MSSSGRRRKTAPPPESSSSEEETATASSSLPVDSESDDGKDEWDGSEEDIADVPASEDENDEDENDEDENDGKLEGEFEGMGRRRRVAVDSDSDNEATTPIAADDADTIKAKELAEQRRKQLLGADSDESDWETDEEIVMSRNTVGNVPMEWYAGLDHIGYNLKGEKIMRPKTRDELEEFLLREEDPSTYWRTVFDDQQGKDVVLSRGDMELLLRAAEGNIADPNVHDPYENPIPWPPPNYVLQHPLLNTPAPKRRFVPSVWETRRVNYLMKQIRAGHIQLDKPVASKPEFYQMWQDNEVKSGPLRKRGRTIPAPNMKLPGHRESYRPPPEYLFDEAEKAAWDQLGPNERPFNYVPTSYDNLRSVPAFEELVSERYRRCLQLLLKPRMLRMRRNVKPRELIPQLPSPEELRPFPSSLNIAYQGHRGHVLSLSVSPDGQWLASGGADATLRVWEIATGRCMALWKFTDDACRAVAWHPNPNVPVVAVAAGRRLLFAQVPICVGPLIDLTTLFNNASLPDVDDLDDDDELDDGNDNKMLSASVDAADTILDDDRPQTSSELPDNLEDIHKSVKAYATWSRNTGEKNVLMQVRHGVRIESFAWHPKGDYFATVMNAGRNSVFIHRLSTHQTQNPFRALKPQKIECVRFHPTRPYFFVATQTIIKVFNLVERKLMKKLKPGVQWISRIEIHPSGDHVLVSSYDRRVCWFDLDLARVPYKKLRYHQLAVRAVAYHPTLPLFASCSDDNKVHVFHGRTYDDLLKNPLIVPVKILRGHQSCDKIGVTDVVFHPTQPWLFSSGADSNIYLYTC